MQVLINGLSIILMCVGRVGRKVPPVFLSSMNIVKVYIALPVTSRPEPTLSERVNKAFARSEELRKAVYGILKKHGECLIIVTPFDVAPVCTNKTEPQIMSECVKAVMEADICVFDKDWRISKGCRVEHTVASLYGKKIIDLSKQ